MAESRDLDRALKELAEAQKDYQEAEDQYEGSVKEWFGSAKLCKALERTGTHWKLPFARTVVSAVKDRMELASVTSPENRVAAWLQETWDANQMDAESDDITEWGLVYGEAYALGWPEEDGGFSVHYNSPRVMRLFYDEETGRTKRFAAKVWRAADGHTRANLYYADRLEKYVSKAKDKTPRSAAEFDAYVDLIRKEEDEDGSLIATEVWPIPHDLGEVPVFHFRTGRPRGRPEHRDAFSPQQMVNKLVIGLMSSNDFQGFPQRWAIAGEAEGDPDAFDDDDLDFLESGEEPEAAADPSARLKSGPGELWWLEGVKDVGQFAPAEVDAFLKPLRLLLEAMGSLTSTPTDFFLSAEGSAPSGESRRVAHAPLTKKVNDRKQNFGATWTDLWSFAAKVGLNLEERPPVAISWAPSESYDDADSWEVASLKQAAGVPKRRTLIEQGYSQDDVEKWHPEEEEDEAALGAMQERVALLTQLAEAASKLGAAKEFGVVTEEQVQELMDTLIPQRNAPASGAGA